jgi:16S rRNA (cytidine1402-2'-O)-methyltransferase
MPGILYIVATPIGNLEDISLRALKVLKESDIILAEDTRKSGILLKYYDIPVRPYPSPSGSIRKRLEGRSERDKFIPTLSYHQHSGEERKLEILKLLMEGKNLSLITDAGTPGVSDPGNELIDFLLSYKPDLKIIPIPGASALTAALSVSGFDVNKFVFLGFLPKKKRSKLFDWLKEGKLSFAYYDSPKRILRNLEMVERVFGSHLKVFVGRELTKIHETHYRGRIRDVHSMLDAEKIRGECVVVVEL